jgi:hypothetical protein
MDAPAGAIHAEFRKEALVERMAIDLTALSANSQTANPNCSGRGGGGGQN